MKLSTLVFSCSIVVAPSRVLAQTVDGVQKRAPSVQDPGHDAGYINIRRDGFLRLLTAIAGNRLKSVLRAPAGFAPLRYFPSACRNPGTNRPAVRPLHTGYFCQTYFKTAV